MDILEELFKRVGTRHRPKYRTYQGGADRRYRVWDARHRRHEQRAGSPVWWDRLASPRRWLPETPHPTARGGHRVLAAFRRHKMLLGLAALLLLFVVGVALGVILLVAVPGIPIVGLLGHAEIADLIETARKMLSEALGVFFELSAVRERNA